RAQGPRRGEEEARGLQRSPVVEEDSAASVDGGFGLLAREDVAGAGGEPRDQGVGEPAHRQLVADLADHGTSRGTTEGRREIGGADPLLALRRGLVVGLPLVHALAHRRRSARLAEEDEAVQLHVGRARLLRELLVPPDPVIGALVVAEQEAVEAPLPWRWARDGPTPLQVAPCGGHRLVLRQGQVV